MLRAAIASSCRTALLSAASAFRSKACLWATVNSSSLSLSSSDESSESDPDPEVASDTSDADSLPSVPDSVWSFTAMVGFGGWVALVDGVLLDAETFAADGFEAVETGLARGLLTMEMNESTLNAFLEGIPDRSAYLPFPLETIAGVDEGESPSSSVDTSHSSFTSSGTSTAVLVGSATSLGRETSGTLGRGGGNVTSGVDGSDGAEAKPAALVWAGFFFLLP